MIINKSIQKKIDQLLELKLSKGVQPSDLAQAIFDKEYFSTHIDKSETEVILKLSYIDILEGGATHTVKMCYHYSLDGVLQEIHEAVGKSSMKTQWSRKQRYRDLTLDIIMALTNSGQANKVNAFIQSLPCDISTVIKTIETRVA